MNKSKNDFAIDALLGIEESGQFDSPHAMLCVAVALDNLCQLRYALEVNRDFETHLTLFELKERMKRVGEIDKAAVIATIMSSDYFHEGDGA